MHDEIIHAVLQHLDSIVLAPKTPGGPGMELMIMNFPNLAKVRRLIGSDDGEIDDLRMDKERSIAKSIELGLEKNRLNWQAKIRYNKEQGALSPFAGKVFKILDQGHGHMSLKDILAALEVIPSIKLIGELEGILQNLADRGLIVQTTNRINLKPGEPLIFNWFVMDEESKRIVSGSPLPGDGKFKGRGKKGS